MNHQFISQQCISNGDPAVLAPLLTHWRYCSLALNHRYIIVFFPNHGFLNNRKLECLLNSLFKITTKKSPKVLVTGLPSSMDVGYQANFLRFVIFPIFQNDQNTDNLYDITFIFDGCHRSWAAETLDKFERDWKYLTYTFAESKFFVTKTLTNGALVTPTPVINAFPWYDVIMTYSFEVHNGGHESPFYYTIKFNGMVPLSDCVGRCWYYSHWFWETDQITHCNLVTHIYASVNWASIVLYNGLKPVMRHVWHTKPVLFCHQLDR